MSEEVQWFDSHCHLQMDEDGAAARDRAFAAGVRRMVCVGTDYQTSLQAIDVAKSAGKDVFATIGLHPHDAINGIELIDELVRAQISKSPNSIVGIGECGLDYYYEHSPRDVQRSVFESQISLAKEFDLTLVIHTRDAWDDTFEILQRVNAPTRTVIHCFTGGAAEALKALELGFYLSFSGIVTFKNSKDLQEAARICPLERLLIETDSPFLAPVPLRGRVNEPANLVRIGEYIAALKGLSVADLGQSIWDTSHRAFALS